jgi:predicted adenylyl cyclase CyaB
MLPSERPRIVASTSMPRNVEWKGRLGDLAGTAARAAALGAEQHAFERQVDTYFRVPHGRLKLRRRWVGERSRAATQDRELPAELIAYRRPDRAGARASDYLRVPVSDAATMIELLREAVGIEVEVEKTRLVFLHDGVRIHLDDVRGCGTFLELEAIVDERCDDTAAGLKVRRLLEQLGLANTPAIAGSYRELVPRVATSA